MGAPENKLGARAKVLSDPTVAIRNETSTEIITDLVNF